MNVTIQKEVHASTNPHKTVCGLPLGKRCKPTGVKVDCLTCAEREEKRFKDIQTYIQKLLEDESLPVDQKMWRLVGYVEQGMRL